MRPLAPGGFETLPTVETAEMPPFDGHRHAVPALTMVFKILQVLKAACTGWAGVESARRGRRVGFFDMDPKVYFGVKGAAAHGAGVFGEEVLCLAREAFVQICKVVFLVDPLDMLLQEVQVRKGDSAVRTRKEFRGWL